MLRRLFRALVKLAVFGALVAGVVKLLGRRQLEPLAPVTTGPCPPLDVDRPVPPPEPVVVAEPVVAEPVVAEPVVAEPVVTEELVEPEAELVEVEELVEPEAELVEAEELVEPEAELVEAEELVEPEAVAANDVASWVDPDDDGECPDSYPVKAKLSSGVFHLPGMMHHDRTKADRCYVDAAAAEADGLRQAKR